MSWFAAVVKIFVWVILVCPYSNSAAERSACWLVCSEEKR